MKVFNEDNRCSGRDSNRAPPEYKSEALPHKLISTGYNWPRIESVVLGTGRGTDTSNMKLGLLVNIVKEI
jgi:hypothetical protein